MERTERIITKLVLIHVVLLLLCQIFFHHLNTFPGLKDLTQYEGVGSQNFEKIVETINSQ